MKQSTEIAQHAVAGQVSKGVVHDFEVIEVEQRDADAGPRLHQTLDLIDEKPPVERAGEVVVHGQAIHLVHLLSEHALPLHDAPRGVYLRDQLDLR